MKDKLTRKAVLKGILKDGLYHLSEIERSPNAYTSVRESWHMRLGHPNNNTLDKVSKIVMSKYHLVITLVSVRPSNREKFTSYPLSLLHFMLRNHLSWFTPMYGALHQYCHLLVSNIICILLMILVGSLGFIL
jgi:hypothetical protein